MAHVAERVCTAVVCRIVVNLKQFSLCGLANSFSDAGARNGLFSGRQPSMHSASKRLLTW